MIRPGGSEDAAGSCAGTTGGAQPDRYGLPGFAGSVGTARVLVGGGLTSSVQNSGRAWSRRGSHEAAAVKEAHELFGFPAGPCRAIAHSTVACGVCNSVVPKKRTSQWKHFIAKSCRASSEPPTGPSACASKVRAAADPAEAAPAGQLTRGSSPPGWTLPSNDCSAAWDAGVFLFYFFSISPP